jgi:hypothetical protein
MAPSATHATVRAVGHPDPGSIRMRGANESCDGRHDDQIYTHALNRRPWVVKSPLDTIFGA